MDPVTSGGGLSYPDSVDSSPRSRGGESWDEPFLSSAAAASSSKLRLMCSYGGRIVPRPTDKSLCYLGGDTRIFVVDRHSSLSDLHSKLSRSLLNNRPFSLKYQLPNEDLDSLISVTTDEDLDNMIEEYDRIVQSASQSSGNSTSTTKSSRIRLFLFPTKPESAPSSIGSLLDDSKSETWFVDALNGAMGIGIDGLPRGMSTDSASVNCLLGLEDDSSVNSRIGVGSAKVELPRPDSSGKLARQDVHSVADSPMLETTSSFGSTSSAPLLSNLPPIRIRPDDRSPDQRYGNLDDHFQQMNLSSAQNLNPNPIPPPIPLPTAAASTPTISPTENPNRVFGSDDEKPDTRKAPPPQPQPQPQVTSQQKPSPIEAPISDQRPVYYQQQERNPIPEPKREIPVSDPATTYRMQQVPEPGYAMPTIPAPEQLRPHAHPHQQQQQQFIPANPHFVPIPSYYQMPHPIQQTQQFDQQIPMYYLPVRQNPQAVPLSKVQVPTKPELQQTLYRTAAPPAPMIHVAAAEQGHAYTGVGYHLMHHHNPSQTAAAAAAPPPMASYGYEYTNAGAVRADTVHQPQVYYSQAMSPPMPAQYQTVMSDALQVGEVKHNRAS